MNEPKNNKKNIPKKELQLQTLNSRSEIILAMVDNASWINVEKREACKMMIDIFMDIADELAKKKGTA